MSSPIGSVDPERPPLPSRSVAPVAGVGPDAPVTVNAHGGRQSALPYRCDLIQALAVLHVSAISARGAEKYGDNNWHKIPVAEHLNHALAHLLAHLAGDSQDDHLGHAAWRVLSALEQKLSGRDEALRRVSGGGAENDFDYGFLVGDRVSHRSMENYGLGTVVSRPADGSVNRVYVRFDSPEVDALFSNLPFGWHPGSLRRASPNHEQKPGGRDAAPQEISLGGPTSGRLEGAGEDAGHGFRVGDRVRHRSIPDHGQGTVVRRPDNGFPSCVYVVFDDQQVNDRYAERPSGWYPNSLERV